MNLYYVLLLNIGIVISTKVFQHKFLTKFNIFSDIKKMSIMSKIIYDYDYYNNNINNKNNFVINPDINKKTNLTIDIIKKNNIYFDLFQFTSFLQNKNFNKKCNKYLDYLDQNFSNTEIYGYFNNKNRLHSLIFINHKLQDINIIFRGSQYFDEWVQNLKFYETKIIFNDKFKIHNGIYQMYINNNIDNNMIYVLKNLFDYFPKYRKIFSGHSKSTIMCILMVMELFVKIKKDYNYEIYCFGNPQILNYELANYLHNHPKLKIYNIVNQNDIISYLPFQNKYQLGLEILLNDNDIFIIKHDYPYKLKFDYFNLFNSIKNHDLKNYIDKILNFK